jgi:hypothetical protein
LRTTTAPAAMRCVASGFRKPFKGFNSIWR